MYGPNDDHVRSWEDCASPHDAEAKTTGTPRHHFAHLFFGNVHVFHFNFGDLVDMLDADGPRDLGTGLTCTSGNVCGALQEQ